MYFEASASFDLGESGVAGASDSKGKAQPQMWWSSRVDHDHIGVLKVNTSVVQTKQHHRSTVTAANNSNNVECFEVVSGYSYITGQNPHTARTTKVFYSLSLINTFAAGTRTALQPLQIF